MPVKFGLVGQSLSHSFSRDFFTQKFAAMGLTDHVYELFELKTIDAFPTLVKQEPQLVGLNVTIPYKIAVMAYLNSVSHEARAAGAVNTIKINRKGTAVNLTGYHTDVYGFEMSIKPFLESRHQRALVLGTGGASKAVQYVLKKLGIDFIVISRNPDNRNQHNQLAYGDINEHMVKHHLFVVNTTPVGMAPDTGASVDFPYNYITPGHFLVDLIYNPAETVFLQKARQKGARILNGTTMLHLQAEKAWEIWNTHE
ncbi:MAG TPA: shikimate dehydrogenase [Flavobacteriales bacterium]|nr:shikimate dehydrogenase [Flavobacteriales bacterium]